MDSTVWRCLFVLMPLAVVPAAGQQPAAAKVLIVSPGADDARIELIHSAVAFWNRTFERLGLDPVLVGEELLVGSPQTRVFENYSRLIWQGAGRSYPGVKDPKPPPEILALDGDVVVFLSELGLMPFAWPMSDGNRYFVALAEPSGSGLDPANAHNVVAHEIGHALGLSHNTSPASLMCEPCQPLQPPTGEYLELTADDERRLIDLYGSP